MRETLGCTVEIKCRPNETKCIHVDPGEKVGCKTNAETLEGVWAQLHYCIKINQANFYISMKQEFILLLLG